jgi:hypothetical protein
MRRFVAGLGAAVAMLIQTPLSAIVTPEPPTPPTVVEVRQAGGLDPATVAMVDEVVRSVRGKTTFLHRVTLRMLSVTRGDEVIQQAPDGFGYPMLTSAVDPLAPVVEPEAIAVLRAGQAVMGALTAHIRGAEVGDLIQLESLDGSVETLRIGAIVPDADLRWSELLVGVSSAGDLGIDRPYGIVIWNTALDPLQASLRLALPQEDVRIYGPSPTSGFDPDAVLPMAMVKERFGEFSLRPDAGDSVIVDPEWFETWIVNADFPIVGSTRCHRMVVPYIRAALADIQEAGLGGALSFSDFQLAGGCYNARFNRGADPGYSLSRHSWGIAIDFNPTTNPYGAEPTVSLAIVEVLRKWGFAWGGGWTVPDGMHFEWAHLPDTYTAECADLTIIPDSSANSWLLAPSERNCT